MRLFNVGWKFVREKVNNNPQFFRNCNNCRYYYQLEGEDEEYCQNEKVLEYDIIVENDRTYCLYWKSL
ncbi:MAG: hypothetical protein H0Z24_05540 [Thermosipho sp. (in: Bacteria)]|nr:hypothetical protein [Thermosipho sp. (in: thermotogales)]